MMRGHCCVKRAYIFRDLFLFGWLKEVAAHEVARYKQDAELAKFLTYLLTSIIRHCTDSTLVRKFTQHDTDSFPVYISRFITVRGRVG